MFAAALRDLLTNGRAKDRNIVICGPANSGKTTILNPITTIFDAFTNPSSSKYAFAVAEETEVIFINGLRWSPDMISCQEFLNFLKGQNVHLAASKSNFAVDTYIFVVMYQYLQQVFHRYELLVAVQILKVKTLSWILDGNCFTLLIKFLILNKKM